MDSPKMCSATPCIAYARTNEDYCAVHRLHPTYRPEPDKSRVNWNKSWWTLEKPRATW
jgi:hypothetical protein